MRVLLVATTIGILAGALSADLVLADADGCREAADDYNDALEQVASRLRRYSSCVGDSRGKDDCSSEFSSLRNAHSEFASAVNDIDDECEE